MIPKWSMPKSLYHVYMGTTAYVPLAELKGMDFNSVPKEYRWLLIPPISEILPQDKTPQGEEYNLPITEWHGNSSILRHFEVSKEQADRFNFRASLTGGHGDIPVEILPGKYTGLYQKSVDSTSPMMSDTPMERKTNRKVLEEARGDVLIGGLGIGMLLPVLLSLDCVSSVTVVEIDHTLTDKVAPNYAHPKLFVVKGDIFGKKEGSRTVLPVGSLPYDTIYFDIWSDVCGDNWEEMKRLKRLYRNRLREGGWMGCWMEEETQRRNKESAKNNRNFYWW